MVGRLIQDQHVASHNHHAGEQNTYFFSTGENAHFLGTVISGEQHTSEETADIGCILDLGELCQPVNDQKIGIKDLGVILREVGLAGRHAPLVGAGIRLHLTDKNFKERCLCQLVASDECDLIVVSDDEGDIVEYLDAVDGLGNAFNGQDFIADLTVRTEVNIRVFTAGRTDLVELNLFQGTLSGSRLLGFGSVRGETGDEFLQLLDLLLFFLVGFLHLFYEKLAGLVPEIIVAGVELDLAVVDICDVCADLV